jgi:hypothetical protein
MPCVNNVLITTYTIVTCWSFLCNTKMDNTHVGFNKKNRLKTMKNKQNKQKIIAITGASLLVATCAHAQQIVDWDFDGLGTQAAPYNSPAPSFGSGTATVLGMNNDYNDGSTPSLPYADVLATAGASTGSGSYAWRVRGGSVAGGAGTPNGWSTQAPIATQGAEFTASTAGYYGISVSFDLYTTSQAEANVALLYTLNGGATWTDAALSYSGSLPTASQNNSTSPNTIIGPYLQLKQSGGGWYNDITANLGDVADNNPNFGIEIVNASTGTDNINQTGGAYNNSSGNWRFDNVAISAVPEPSTVALAGCGFATLIGLLRLKKRQA